MQKKRRVEISMLNVLFCLIVIFIHVISYAVSAFAPNTVKYNLVMIPWRLSAFVVQGFVLLSGVKLFLNKKDSLPFFKYIKSRIAGIVVPYIVCFLVYYVGFMVVYDYPLDGAFMAKQFFTGSLVYHLYFIPIILQFDLLFPIWKRVVNKCHPMLVIPFAVIIAQIFENNLPAMINAVFPDINFAYNDRIFTTYLSYWLIGCYIGKYYDAFCEMLKKNFRTVCVIFAFVLAFVVYFTYLAFNGIAYVPSLNNIHGLYIIYVCIFLYAVALKIPEKAYEKIPLIKEIDGASLYIYLYHVLVILIADLLLGYFAVQAQGISFAVRAVLAYGVTPLGCILYIRIRKRVKEYLKSKKQTVIS